MSACPDEHPGALEAQPSGSRDFAHEYAVDALHALRPAVPQGLWMGVPLGKFSRDDLQRLVDIGWEEACDARAQAARDRDSLLDL